MQAIVITDLCRNYGSRRGISNVNLKIEEGEIFGFLGPNGSGKSTTIRVLMGLLRASSGAAAIFGKDCWNDGPTIRRDVGYVAGDVRLYPWLTIRLGLLMLSRIRGLKEMHARGLDLVERFQLEPDLPIRKMSRGNRQKVALVLALAHSPKLIVLDEPTSGLDPLMQDTLMACLRELATNGHTVMISSHTLSEVETLCDHIAIVRDGRIVEDSTVKKLQANAPRQIVITLRPDQEFESVRWPNEIKICQLPRKRGGQDSALAETSSTPTPMERTCQLELIGSSSRFITWAAAQDFADISIGAPSLEILFRRYYQSNQGDL